MSWYVAGSLNKLLDQLNARAPHRSKISDGSIGDASHSARESDHNPTASGQVCARDFTHDPAGGLDGNWLAAALVASRDPRIKYVIWNRRIIDSRAGQHPWQWMPYNGINPHNHHVHVSVFAGPVGDNAAAWNLGAPGGGSSPTKPTTEEIMRMAEPRSLPRSADWQQLTFPVEVGAIGAGRGNSSVIAVMWLTLVSAWDDKGTTEYHVWISGDDGVRMDPTPGSNGVNGVIQNNGHAVIGLPVGARLVTLEYRNTGRAQAGYAFPQVGQ